MGNPQRKIDNFTPTAEEMESARELILLIEGAKVSSNLREVVKSMLERVAEGNSVSILSKKKEYSTGEAAELLNVSVTYLLKVIDRGDLSCRKVGKHRRIKAHDLEAYRQQLESRQEEAVNRLYEISAKYESDE